MTLRIILPAHNILAIPRRTVRSEIPLITSAVEVRIGEAYKVVFNPQSAVTAITEDGKRLLGLKPGEFDFVCPWCTKSETIPPREDHEIPGHSWRVIPVGGPELRIEVNGEVGSIQRIFIGMKGWLVEYELAKEEL